MSGLAAVLAGHVAPGVYRWHAAYDVDDVRHTVEHAGWAFAHLDGWAIETKSELLDALGVALDFPDHYGRNFDALADCLYDVPGDGPDGLVLLWDGWGPLARADEQAFSVTLRVLAGRAEAEREGSFSVLLRGAGPAVDVPGLD